MSNDKDFKVKKGVKPTVYHEKLGTVVVPEGLGYDLSSASYDNKSFSVFAQASVPISSFVKNDGTKMYILQSGGALYQYSLSTPHDVSTASYDSVSFSFSSQDANPIGITFKPDGTKMYMGGNTTDSIYQYSLSTPWSINTASYDSKSKNISAQGPYPIGLDFKPDGTIMIMCDGDEINQYTLSTAWDVSTATYVANINAKDQDTQPHSVKFNADGTSYFLTVSTTPRVLQYNMSSAYTVSTSTYSGVSLSVAAEIYLRSSVFSNDGKKLYVVGANTDTVYQYSTVLTINTLDLSTGSVFQLTPASNIQLNLSNPAASGTVSGATLLLSASGTAYTITYNSSIDFPGGTAPTSPAIGDMDVLVFTTRDGGTSYKAALAIDGAK